MDRAAVEHIASRLEDEAHRQERAAHRFAHAEHVGHVVRLDPGKGEFSPTTVRSIRLILADFCRELARDLRFPA